MDSERTPSDRFMDWLIAADPPDRMEAEIEFRNLYRLPCMVYYFQTIAQSIAELDKVSGADLVSEAGRMAAVERQGYLKGLSQALNLAVSLAIPEENENG